MRIAEDAGYQFNLLRGVIDVNEEQFERIADKVQAQVGGELSGVTVAVLGLTFKANTDDLRDSPALEVAARLKSRGAILRAFDPAVHSPVDNIAVYDSAYTAAEGASTVVLLTEWDEFRWLDWEKMAQQMTLPRLVDARNLLDPAAMRRRGFEYEGLGRS